MIEKVKEIHREYWQKVQDGKYEAGTQGGDVLIVTHGHFSKCFLARWCELPLITGELPIRRIRCGLKRRYQENILL